MSTIGAMLDELQHLGVTLWHDGDRVRYRGPKDALTTELLGRLRTHKDEIERFLTRAAQARGDGQTTTSIEPSIGPARLSYAQEGLWFLHQLGGRAGGPGAAYNVPTAMRLRGPLDVSALKRSLAEICQRHAVLRTRFVPSQEGAVQIVESATPALRVVDLSSTPAREPAAREFIETEAKHVFELESAPPVRFTLLRLGAEQHILVSLLHHMVTDGWSMWVLFRELVALYEDFANGRPPSLPDLAVQYADYAVHQGQTVTSETCATALAYWKEQLAGAPDVIDLPLDRPRPTQQSFHGGVVRFELDRAQTGALKQLAHECNASLFMVLLAGYATLLGRYAGQSDIIVGTPVANRARPETESLIGLFSDYLPLRVDLDGDPSARELIARIRRMTLDGYAHQRVPFGKLVDWTRSQRRLGATPLFQVALVLQNLPTAPLALPGIDVEQLPIDRATAKIDVSVLLEESDGVTRGEFEYCSGLFEPGTARRMTARLVRVLDALPRSPDVAVSRLTLPGRDERVELLERWSGSRATRREDGLVHERFRAQVDRTPEAIALVAGEERLTYAALAARVWRMARHLASLGVDAETRVAVCLPRSSDLIVTLLAVLEAGGAYVPLDSAHPPQRLASIVKDAEAGVLVTNADTRERLQATAAVVCVDRDADEIGRHEARPLGRAASPDQLAYVIYTSGSTGRPKGVMVPHRTVCSLVRALADTVYARCPKPVNVALVAATVFDASVQQIFGCLLLGHALHVVDDDARQSGQRLLAFYEAHRVTLADGTPSLLGVLLDAGLGTRPDSDLEHLLIGGEALPTRLIERLHAQDVRGRITVTNLYGPTECGVDVTFKTVAPGETLRREFVPIGRPLSNARLYVLDAEGGPAPVGVRGDIWIGGPCLARGYSGQGALTARAYCPDPFVAGGRLYATGDRGRWTADGEIEFLGRIDNQVKVRGFRVELGEVEAALRRHREVKGAVVAIERPDDEHARLVAYVVPHADAPTVGALRDHLSTSLPAYMVPSAFMVLDRFPLNASGKVDRARMPHVEDAREMDRGAEHVEPRGTHEQVLAQAWAAVLGQERVGAGDHFFSLGGDSIKALQVVSRVRQAGLRMELRDLFENPTLSTLAPLLEPFVAPAEEPDVSAGEVPLGPVQAAFLQDHPGPKHHFHQALTLAADEPLDVKALDAAIAAVFAHHDALRTRFRHVEGRWVQACGPADRPPRVEVVDLSLEALPGEGLRARAGAGMGATDLARGPLFSAALYRLPDGERLMLTAHHLIVDGVSWRVLIEDLEAAYTQALAGADASLPPPTNSYGRWAAGMRRLAERLDPDEHAYWLRAERAPSGTLPFDATEVTARRRDRAELRLQLTEDVTRCLLSSSHDAYGTRMDDLLLAAFGRALTAWTGARRWRVLLESHGREPLWDGADVSRTVGWFTARYPVALDLEGPDDIGRQIKGVKETLRRVPNGGSTYEAARHLDREAGGPERAALPTIVFNYLGQLGEDLRAGRWRWVDEETGAVIAPDAPLVHDLEVVGFVADDRLVLAIGYGRVQFARNTVARLAAELKRALVDVVEHTTHKRDRELTPSDIDYDGFDADALDEFIENL